MRGERDVEGGARSRLLQAAGLFGQYSFPLVGISRILQEAGVQAPTLYHHFGDKEGLFVAWSQIAAERLGSEITVVGNGASSPTMALETIARCLASDSHPDVIQMLKDCERLERPESRESIVESVHRAVYEPLITVFLSAMEAGDLRTDSVQKAVAAFLAATQPLRPNGMLAMSSDDGNLGWVVERFLYGFSGRSN